MSQRRFLEQFLNTELHLHADPPKLSSPDLSVYKAKGRSFARFQTILSAASVTRVQIMTIRCESALSGSLLLQEGFFEAHGVSSNDWVSVYLNNTVPNDMLCNLLRLAASFASDQTTNKDQNRIREWLIPANPKYFDLFQAFRENKTILWKQSSKIEVGDIVYMYVAAPYSAILFQCRAVEVNIPYTRKNSRRHITTAMRIQLLYTYDEDAFTLQALKDYGITTVRGPRGVPIALSNALLKQSHNIK